jgi:hypothetical protein
MRRHVSAGWIAPCEDPRQIKYGAPVNDDETPLVIDYLVKNFGPKK